MDAARFRRLEAFFARAVGARPEERDRVLAEAAAFDAEVGEELARLLAARQATGVLQALVQEAGEAMLGDQGAAGVTVRARPGAAPPLGSPSVDSPAADLIARLGSRATAGSRYRIDGEVARGGMGAILRAFDPDLRRVLAMKVALAPDASVEDARQQARIARFLEEAQITGQLDHPGIVPVHELGLDAQRRPYFTMRLVGGRDLGAIYELSRTGDEGWSTARVLGVLLKVCEALAYAHSKGVIHRDLKPANVMVGRFGEVYVMDWGLAKVIGEADARDLRVRPPAADAASLGSIRTEERDADPSTPLLTMDGTVLGTPAYMSPEQACGDVAAMDARSDVYALGAMLYHLLAGHAPYHEHGETLGPLRLWQKVASTDPRPLAAVAPSAPRELVAIVERAMARAMDERYPSMLALADDLRAYVEGRVVGAYESGSFAELRKWVGRNKALSASLVAVVLAAAIGAVAFAIKADQATEAATESRRHLDRFLQIADVVTLRELQAEVDSLWPESPEMVDELADWLRRARELVGRRPALERALAGLDGGDPEPTAPEAADGRRLGGPADRFVRANLERLIEDMREMEEVGSGAIATIERRHEWASTVRQRTVLDEQAAWAAAIASIGDASECPRYRNLQLTPQLGLVPLGRDPASGLWEFWHPRTGERPRVDGSGRHVVGDESGLLFVLLPGGAFWMGASANEEDPNHDPDAGAAQSPVHEVTLAAFFLSKYELTQGQWLRFTGTNPSLHRAGRIAKGVAATLTTPVESLSFDDCARTLQRLGLDLPTEAQWEYACRAETSTIWHCGNTLQSLRGFANLADEASKDWLFPGSRFVAGLDDGHRGPAPVGSYRPNGFGLFDMLGNVAEWCRDEPRSYRGTAEPLPAARRGYRVIRGGSFLQPAGAARSADRGWMHPTAHQAHLGCRPCLELSAR